MLKIKKIVSAAILICFFLPLSQCCKDIDKTKLSLWKANPECSVVYGYSGYDNTIGFGSRTTEGLAIIFVLFVPMALVWLEAYFSKTNAKTIMQVLQLIDSIAGALIGTPMVSNHVLWGGYILIASYGVYFIVSLLVVLQLLFYRFRSKR